MGPGELADVLSNLPNFKTDKNLLVGFDSADDAAVYKLNENQAIISTLDFFTPMVKDPYLFGKIAAANAMSDVYAMGGKVLLAMNIVCFPEKESKETLGLILKGGADKLIEGGGILCGGHSIYDPEVKYGLSVIGTVHPDKVLANNTAKEDDYLILTKPLGVGLVATANSAGMAKKEHFEKAILAMERLNMYAAEKMLNYNVNACTDITGFGILAHVLEMAGDKFTFVLDTASLPILDGAYEYAKEHYVTAAGQRNRNHVSPNADISMLDRPLVEILFDPQTSGGLLISVSPEDAALLLKDIQKDDPDARIIGQVVKREQKPLIVL